MVSFWYRLRHGLTTIYSRSRYGSLMYEARRKVGPEPVADMSKAATEAEFELDMDIEAAMAEAAEAESSIVQPAHHHHHSPALVTGNGHEALAPKMQGSDQRKSDLSTTFHSTPKSPKVMKDRDCRRRCEMSRVTKKEHQLSITGWVSRNK